MDRSVSRFGKQDLLVFDECQVGQVFEIEYAAEFDTAAVAFKMEVAFHFIPSIDDCRQGVTLFAISALSSKPREVHFSVWAGLTWYTPSTAVRTVTLPSETSTKY